MLFDNILKKKRQENAKKPRQKELLNFGSGDRNKLVAITIKKVIEKKIVSFTLDGKQIRNRAFLIQNIQNADDQLGIN